MAPPAPASHGPARHHFAAGDPRSRRSAAVIEKRQRFRVLPRLKTLPMIREHEPRALMIERYRLVIQDYVARLPVRRKPSLDLVAARRAVVVRAPILVAVAGEAEGLEQRRHVPLEPPHAGHHDQRRRSDAQAAGARRPRNRSRAAGAVACGASVGRAARAIAPGVEEILASPPRGGCSAPHRCLERRSCRRSPRRGRVRQRRLRIRAKGARPCRVRGAARWRRRGRRRRRRSIEHLAEIAHGERARLEGAADPVSGRALIGAPVGRYAEALLLAAAPRLEGSIAPCTDVAHLETLIL